LVISPTLLVKVQKWLITSPKLLVKVHKSGESWSLLRESHFLWINNSRPQFTVSSQITESDSIKTAASFTILNFCTRYTWSGVRFGRRYSSHFTISRLRSSSRTWRIGMWWSSSRSRTSLARTPISWILSCDGNFRMIDSNGSAISLSLVDT
jgi:hypothetical protein